LCWTCLLLRHELVLLLCLLSILLLQHCCSSSQGISISHDSILLVICTLCLGMLVLLLFCHLLIFSFIYHFQLL
jgi:hypothetical protein